MHPTLLLLLTTFTNAITSVACYLLAFSLLSVSGYHFLSMLSRCKKISAFLDNPSSESYHKDFTIPMTTTSFYEKRRYSRSRRMQQLYDLLKASPHNLKVHDISSVPEELLTIIILSDAVVRRLVSLIVSHSNKMPATALKEDTDDEYFYSLPLPALLLRIYPLLVSSPLLYAKSSPTSNISLSVVVPAYNERSDDLIQKLSRNLSSIPSASLSSIQLIIVNAGLCDSDLQLRLRSSICSTVGSLVVKDFGDGGGRGPCLNHGASLATGINIAFLHADTLLPKNWDYKINQALAEDGVNACAFNFGIDIKALKTSILGIRAVEITANLRTRLYTLPYGDQCISISKSMFDFIGGFPDQCLMEDYEMISLLRLRAFTLKRSEKFKIIPGEPALCAPRRWEKLGVLKTTLTNSKIVNTYSAGVGPDELFRTYYGMSPEKRKDNCAGWEVELDERLKRA